MRRMCSSSVRGRQTSSSAARSSYKSAAAGCTNQYNSGARDQRCSSVSPREAGSSRPRTGGLRSTPAFAAASRGRNLYFVRQSAPLPPNGDGGSSAERHSRPPRERQPREELGSHGTARVLATADNQSRSRSGVPLGRPRDRWQSTPLCQEDCRSIPTRRSRRCSGIQRRCAIRAPSRYTIRVSCLTDCASAANACTNESGAFAVLQGQ